MVMIKRLCWLFFYCCILSACEIPPPESGTLGALVYDYEAGVISRNEFREAIRAWPANDVAATLPNKISKTTLLRGHGRKQEYHLTGDLTVARDAILVIEEGTRILMGAKAELIVKGRLYAIGREGAKISFVAERGARYKAISLRSGPNQIVSTIFKQGEHELEVSHDADITTLVEKSQFDAWGTLAISLIESGGLSIIDSDFGYQTEAEDVSGETIGAVDSGFLLISGSRFNFRRGYHDVVDLDNCTADSWPIIIGNRFEGGEDDAIDLDHCSAMVIGNWISNFTPIDIKTQFRGMNGGGVTGEGNDTHPFIANNIIENCYHAIGFKSGAQPVIVNNTVINNNIGITLYQTAKNAEPPHGILLNNILWNNNSWFNKNVNQDIVLNGKWWKKYNQVDAVQATIDARFNIVANGSTAYPGTGNLLADPLFVYLDGLPTLKKGSPAISSGMDDLSGIQPERSLEQALNFLQTDIRKLSRKRINTMFPGISRGALESPTLNSH